MRRRIRHRPWPPRAFGAGGDVRRPGDAAAAPFSSASGRRGFTLMEVMIAMAILAISLVAVYQLQSQSVSMATDSRFLTTASLLAQGRMAQIAAALPRDIVPGNGDFGDDFPDYTWQLEVAGVEESTLIRKLTLSVVNQRMAVRNTFSLTLYRVVVP